MTVNAAISGENIISPRSNYSTRLAFPPATGFSTPSLFAHMAMNYVSPVAVRLTIYSDRSFCFVLPDAVDNHALSDVLVFDAYSYILSYTDRTIRVEQKKS